MFAFVALLAFAATAAADGILGSSNGAQNGEVAYVRIFNFIPSTFESVDVTFRAEDDDEDTSSVETDDVTFERHMSNNPVTDVSTDDGDDEDENRQLEASGWGEIEILAAVADDDDAGLDAEDQDAIDNDDLVMSQGTSSQDSTYTAIRTTETFEDDEDNITINDRQFTVYVCQGSCDDELSSSELTGLDNEITPGAIVTFVCYASVAGDSLSTEACIESGSDTCELGEQVFDEPDQNDIGEVTFDCETFTVTSADLDCARDDFKTIRFDGFPRDADVLRTDITGLTIDLAGLGTNEFGQAEEATVGYFAALSAGPLATGGSGSPEGGDFSFQNSIEYSLLGNELYGSNLANRNARFHNFDWAPTVAFTPFTTGFVKFVNVARYTDRDEVDANDAGDIEGLVFAITDSAGNIVHRSGSVAMLSQNPSGSDDYVELKTGSYRFQVWDTDAEDEAIQSQNNDELEELSFTVESNQYSVVLATSDADGEISDTVSLEQVVLNDGDAPVTGTTQVNVFNQIYGADNNLQTGISRDDSFCTNTGATFPSVGASAAVAFDASGDLNVFPAGANCENAAASIFTVSETSSSSGDACTIQWVFASAYVAEVEDQTAEDITGINFEGTCDDCLGDITVIRQLDQDVDNTSQSPDTVVVNLPTGAVCACAAAPAEPGCDDTDLCVPDEFDALSTTISSIASQVARVLSDQSNAVTSISSSLDSIRKTIKNVGKDVDDIGDDIGDLEDDVKSGFDDLEDEVKKI